MSARLFPLIATLLLLAGGSGAAPADADGLPEASWKKTRKQAGRLMKEPGRRVEKQKLIRTLGEDDSRRAAELLVKWTLRSLKLQQGSLSKALAEEKEDFEKVDKLMRRAYDPWPPKVWRDKGHKAAWDGARKKYEQARKNHRIEEGVRFSLGEAFAHIRDAEAVTYLLEKGLPSVQKAKTSELAQLAIAKCLLRQPKQRILRWALVTAADASRPKLRVAALNWFGQHQLPEGYTALLLALQAEETAVRRVAVQALKALDDKRCVKPLIDALAKADALLLEEMDAVLHYFTGRSFESSATVWKRWWTEEGAAFLATQDTPRHQRKREALSGGTRVRFYGIPTASHHVVFVLDRSGSMKNKASDSSVREKEKQKKPKGPVTGPGQGDGGPAGKKKGREAVAGDTKLEVARNQLARSVDELAKDVKFNIVFYSNDVKVWKEPPALLPSTRKNKEDAKKWFMELAAAGPTLLFGALSKALEYADTFGEDKKRRGTGADTIFLLSDGSPTNAEGKALPTEEFERHYAAFLEANKIYRCVVHTIGIGPGHNVRLMQRIARDTGGQYKAVGAR